MRQLTLHRPLAEAGRPAQPKPTIDSPLELLSEDACWRQLRSTFQGLLTYRSGRGDTTLPVTYDLWDDGVVLHLASYNPACQYVPGREVELEVTRRTRRGSRTTVRVAGTAQQLNEAEAEDKGPPKHLEQWPPGVGAIYVAIPAARVKGFRQRLTKR